MGENVSCALVNNDHDLQEMLKVRDRAIALFHASWCPFCVKFLPIFQKQAEQDGKRFLVIVQDDEESMAARYAVEVYPTVLFFENGIVSRRLDGVLGVGLDEKQLVAFISNLPFNP